ncbi:MAG: TMEM175 family protein [Candidatus Dormibacteraceae bacterium]
MADSREAEARPESAFRERGKDITRLEGFSDCSFGFAITLLVLSLEVPRSFDELLKLMSAVPTFAITFAMVGYIWYTQYRFYRRFGLEDPATIVLNLALLFVVLVHVYPLKFMFGVSLFGSLDNPPDVRELYLLYGVGFAAVYAVIAALYANGLRQGARLELNHVERVLTRCWIEEQGLSAAVGLVSVGLTLVVPDDALWVPGIWYFAIAGVKVLIGIHTRRAALRAAGSEPERPLGVERDRLRLSRRGDVLLRAHLLPERLRDAEVEELQRALDPGDACPLRRRAAERGAGDLEQLPIGLRDER